MKKLILIILLFSEISIVYSQKKFDLTFIASPQVSWLMANSKNINNGKSHNGYCYGFEGDIFLHSDTYLIGTGMIMSMVGGSLSNKESISFGSRVLPKGTSVDYYLNDLEFPLVLKMRTRNFGRLRYFAQYGLINWINLRTKATTSDTIFQKHVVKHEIHFYNVGLNLGVGMDYDLRHGNALTGGLVYSDGFSDTTTKISQKNITVLNIVRLRVGYVF